MHFRLGLLVAAIALLGVSACTSSGGSDTVVKKTGGGWFQARPLIMPGQRTTTVRADSFASVRAPTSEDAYNRLSPAQQAELANALRGVDCAHPPKLSTSADRVVCDDQSDAFLLGASLFTGDDVTRARALPPSDAVADWQVSVSLTPAAGKKLYAWTSGHHVTARSGEFNEVQTSADPPCGPLGGTACSDFTAYISDDLVVSVPVSFAGVQNTVSIAGDFTATVATKLARRLAR